jgi:hypothetical protein
VIGPVSRRDGLAFAAMMPLERFGDLVARFDRDADVLVRRSAVPGFRPIPLGVHAVLQLRSNVEPVTGANVVARLPGRGDSSGSDAVLVTTGYDGADVGEAASLAVILGAAAAVQFRPSRPRRSTYFVFTAGTGPEQVGVRALIAQPPVPLERIAAVVGVAHPEPTSGSPAVSGLDADAAGLAGILAAAAMQSGAPLEPWRGHAAERISAPHTLFATEGVPGLTLDAGGTATEGPAGGSYGGLAVQVAVLARLLLLVADADDRPQWSTESPYRPAWERLERRRLRGAGR